MNNPSLTERQKQVLSQLRLGTKSPTEITRVLNFASKGTTYKCVQALIAKGVADEDLDPTDPGEDAGFVVSEIPSELPPLDEVMERRRKTCQRKKANSKAKSPGGVHGCVRGRLEMALQAKETADLLLKSGTLSKEAHQRVSDSIASIEAHTEIWKEAGMREWLARSMASAMRGVSGVTDDVSRAMDDRASASVGREAKRYADRFGAAQKAFPQGEDDLIRQFTMKDTSSAAKGGLALLPLGLLGMPLVQGVRDQRKMDESQARMMDIYPDLAQEDPEAVARAFDVVRTYAPTLARSPVAAGAAVQKFVQFDAIDPQQVQLLLSIEEKGQKLNSGASMPAMVGQQLMSMATGG